MQSDKILYKKRLNDDSPFHIIDFKFELIENPTGSLNDYYAIELTCKLIDDSVFCLKFVTNILDVLQYAGGDVENEDVFNYSLNYFDIIKI